MRATSVLRSRDGAPELPGLPVESLPHSAAICASVTCPSRALVQESVYDRFMERAIKRVEAIR